MLICEWLTRKGMHGLALNNVNENIRNLIYFVLLFCLFVWGGHAENFIYFQF